MRLFLVLVLTVLLPVASFAEGGVIKLGLILPLSGPGAVWGQHLRQGAELAASGSVDIELLFEDDHLDASAAIAAYRKLRSVQGIDAVVLFGAQSARAVVPLAERDRVISLVITTDSHAISGTRYAVRLALDALPQAAALIAHLKRDGVKNAALVGTTQEAMLEYLSSFVSEARREGINIISKTDYAKGETDFRTQIDLILTSKPDVIVSSLLPPSFSAFSKQLRQRNSSIRIVGFAQSENPSEIKAAEGSLDRLVFTRVDLAPNFVESYRTKYSEPPQSYACYTFDFVRMLLSMKSISAEEVVPRLRNLVNFSGACGSYSAKSDFGFALSTRLVKVEGDHFKDGQ